jgi:hypothetical protein
MPTEAAIEKADRHSKTVKQWIDRFAMHRHTAENPRPAHPEFLVWSMRGQKVHDSSRARSAIRTIRKASKVKVLTAFAFMPQACCPSLRLAGLVAKNTRTVQLPANNRPWHQMDAALSG